MPPRLPRQVSPPVTLSSDGVTILVSVLVSVADALTLLPLLHTQLGMEARIGIEQGQGICSKSTTLREACVEEDAWAVC